MFYIASCLLGAVLRLWGIANGLRSSGWCFIVHGWHSVVELSMSEKGFAGLQAAGPLITLSYWAVNRLVCAA